MSAGMAEGAVHKRISDFVCRERIHRHARTLTSLCRHDRCLCSRYTRNPKSEILLLQTPPPQPTCSPILSAFIHVLSAFISVPGFLLGFFGWPNQREGGPMSTEERHDTDSLTRAAER